MQPNSNESFDGESDGDLVLVDRDDVTNYNPDQILPESPQTIQEIRTWLQPTSYDVVGGEYHKHRASHAPGTGSWLTSSSTYQEWLQSTDHGLLWIKGIPGSGKSVMAANLIGEIKAQHPGSPVLFFFFRQIIDANHEPSALLRDWMDQVLAYSPPLQKQLKAYVEDNRSVSSISMEDMWKHLHMALASLPEKAFCVADALDEMDQGHETFLKDLGSLGQWKSGKVKVLITSRPVPRVEAPLRNTPCLHLRLEENLVDVDIAKFVQLSLSNSSIPKEHWSVIADAVPGRANGLFLYAKLAMEAFLQPNADINTVLSQLPTDLNVMYTNLLKEHARRSGVEAGIQHLILQAVTHANRPLRLLELAEMVMLNSSDSSNKNLKETKDLIRAACGPLLEILTDETVSVVHHSFTEYLKGMTRSNDEDDKGYPILQAGSTHARLALACLHYLQGDCLDTFNVQADDESDSKRDDYFWADGRAKSISKENVKLRLKHPFFQYAVRNWNRHVKKAEAAGHDQTEINAEIGRLMKDDKRMIAWFLFRWPRHSATIKSTTKLHMAGQAGLTSYSKILLKQTDVDIHDSRGCTPLWLAATQGHAALISELIKAGANPDQPDAINGYKPLHQAALKNYHEAAKVLLEAGVDPLTGKTKEPPGMRCGNAPRTIGHTPLMYACQNGHVETVEVFLPFTQSLETVHRALAWAAGSGQSKVVARLLQYPGVDPNSKVRGDTILFTACGSFDTPTIIALLEAGADPTVGSLGSGDEFRGIGRAYHNDKRQMGCLRRLCDANTGRMIRNTPEDLDGLQKIFSLFIKAGVDIHQRTHSGNTPLHGAIDSPSLVRLLLDAGADANAADYSGTTPLHRVKKKEIMQLLVEKGQANIDAKQNDGKIPLLCILDKSNKDLALKFLEYGPNCNAVDADGNGPLHIAAKTYTSKPEIIQSLVKHGADPNLKNEAGLTPLLSLRPADNHFETMAGVLLEAGADINVQDRNGATILFHLSPTSSMFNQDLSSKITYLIDQGGSMSGRDYNGRTCLHEAVKNHSISRLDQFPWDTYLRPDDPAGRGLDIQVVDHSGNSLLHELALRNDTSDANNWPNVVHFWEQLTFMGLDPEQKNHAGRTPLHILCATFTGASSSSEPSPVDFVISRTKNINNADHDGVTPLHIAASVDERFVKRLLDAGADPTVTTHEGLTPLHIACHRGESNIVGLLLGALETWHQQKGTVVVDSLRHEASASLPLDKTVPSPRSVIGINAQTYTGGKFNQETFTPLFYACQSGRPETVALLLEAGADLKNGNMFEACARFEEDYGGWGRQLFNDPRANGRTISFKTEDLSRKQETNSCGLREYETARLEEILDMLVEHGADVSQIDRNFFDNPLRRAVERNRDYTAACLRGVRDKSQTEEPAKKLTKDTSVSRLMNESLAEARIKSLKDSGSVVPEDSNTEIFRDLLVRREYRLVEELIHLGANFLLRNPDIYQPCNLQFLIEHGFTSLVEKIGPVVADAALKKGEWHAFGDPTRPGLWYSKRDLEPTRDRPGILLPFLCSAVGRTLPNMGMVRLLVENFGIDVNEQIDPSNSNERVFENTFAGSALHRASMGDHWWQVHQALPYLLNAGADINLRNEKGQTPLHMALQGTAYLHREAAKILIEAGADVNAIDKNGRSCLASAQNDVVLIKHLISHGATVNYDAILAAIDAGNAEVLQELLSGGFDLGTSHGTLSKAMVEEWRNSTKERRCQGTGVQVLLNHGADPFQKFASIPHKHEKSSNKTIDATLHVPSIEVPEGYIEFTLLHALLVDGNVVDDFLARPGLDVNHRDAQGRTLLLAACQGPIGPDYILGSYKEKPDTPERVTVFQHLLSLGADLEARDHAGRNALHLLLSSRADFGNRKESLGYVIDKVPALLRQVDSCGRTPLHYALSHDSQQDKTEIAQRLLSAGADRFAVDSDGNGILHMLVKSLKRKDIRTFFRDLVSGGMDINARNNLGQAPVCQFYNRRRITDRFSMFFRDTETVSDAEIYQIFKDSGTDFFVKDAEGRGLLHLAAINEVERFKELLDMGLDPIMEDNAQRTALDVAAACENQEILALFEKK